MAGKAFSVHVDIGGRLNASLGAAVRAADAQVSSLGRTMSAVNARTHETINSLGSGLARAGRKVQEVGRNVSSSVSAPMGIVGAIGFDAAYQFEKTSNAVQAVGSLTDEQIGKLRAYSKELNAAFPYTNSQIMGAAEELTKAGFTFDQVLGSLRSTLNLGLAGDIDLQSASDIASNILTSMNLPRSSMEEASASLQKVVDNLAYAANRSNTDVRLMGETFKYVGPMARAAGLSIAEVSALSMTMANNGIKGSEAGVALRSALVRMVRPTKPMLAALDQLNLSLGDFVKNGREVSSLDIIGSLAVDGVDASGAKTAIDRLLATASLQADPAKMIQGITAAISDSLGSTSVVDAEKLSDNVSAALTSAGSQVDLMGFVKAMKDRGASLGDIARIFDARQGSRLMTLLMENDLAAAARGVDAGSAGMADSVSAIRMKGVVGDLAAVTAAWENMWTTIGDSGALRDVGQVFRTISSGLERLSEANPVLLRFATWGAMATIALGPFLMIAGGAARVLAPLASGLISLGAAATVGLATQLTAVAGGVRALALAATVGAATRLRAMATGLIALAAVGGRGAVLGALAGGLASFGKSLLLFPLTTLTAIVAPLATVGALTAAGLIAITAAFAALGVWVYNNWEGLKNFFSGFTDGLSRGLSPQIVGAVNAVASGFGSIFNWVSQLLGPLQATNAEWQSWGSTIGGAVAGAVNAVASAIERVIGLFSSAIEKARGLANAVATLGGGYAAPGVSTAPAPRSFLQRYGTPQVDGARAAGGPVWRGGSFLVGEEGPEVFTPGASGHITPNHRLGSLLGKAEGAAARSEGHANWNRAGISNGMTVNAPITINVASGDPHEVAREAERAVERVIRQAEGRQRGRLSD